MSLRRFYNILQHITTGPCITNVFATRRKNFSQWHRSFQRKLLSHWLKFLRHVAITLVIQGPGRSAPGYLQNLVELYTPRRTLRRSSDKLTLSIPKVRTLYGERSFRYHCAVEWNTLPYDIRSCESSDSFKAKLKTIFFLRHIISQIVFYLLQWIMYCLLNVLTRYTEIYSSHINLHRFNYLV